MGAVYAIFVHFCCLLMYGGQSTSLWAAGSPSPAVYFRPDLSYALGGSEMACHSGTRRVVLHTRRNSEFSEYREKGCKPENPVVGCF
jgi:hypothetical protein